MKRIISKVFGNRCLWSAFGVFMIGYFFLAMHGVNIFRRIGIYFEALMPLILAATVLLVLYMSGMEKDFADGFRLAFGTGGRDIPQEKLRRAVEALGCAERTAVAASVITLMTGVMDMLSSIHNLTLELFWEFIDIPLGILSAYVMYPAVFLLALTPVKARLKGMAVSGRE